VEAKAADVRKQIEQAQRENREGRRKRRGLWQVSCRAAGLSVSRYGPRFLGVFPRPRSPSW